ncbi:MAG: hypothetical protein R2821_07065 [Flavobacteriaceae bacterium]
MKQKLLLRLFLIFTIKTFSQDYKFSLEANSSIPVGDNFLEKIMAELLTLGQNIVYGIKNCKYWSFNKRDF